MFISWLYWKLKRRALNVRWSRSTIPWSRWTSMIPVLFLTSCFVVSFTSTINSRPEQLRAILTVLYLPRLKSIWNFRRLLISKWFSVFESAGYIDHRQCVFENFPPPRKPVMREEKKISLMIRIGHFRVFLRLCFKTSLSAKPLIWKWVLHAVSFSCKSKAFS